MTDKQYENIIQLTCIGTGWIPGNDKAQDILDNSAEGTQHDFIECTGRSHKLMGLYFELLGYIHDYMPPLFRQRVHKHLFYKWLKHLQKYYKVVYEFKDVDKADQIRKYLTAARCNKENPKGLRATYKQIDLIAEALGYTNMIEYESIAFGNMSEQRFKEYFRDQLPFIYTYVIGKMFEGEIYDNIIATIEREFERAFTKYRI